MSVDSLASSAAAPYTEPMHAPDSLDLLEYLDRNLYYEIVERRESENALVLFTRHLQTSESVVMKLLKPYQDTRYDLSTPEKRQQCQLEALERNRSFTPETYIGLAAARRPDPAEEVIQIGQIMAYPGQDDLEAETEYALLMYRLRDDRRLDVLLEKGTDDDRRTHIHALSSYVAHVHAGLASALSAENEPEWGSCVQLQEKLQHNLDLLGLLVSRYKQGWGESYSFYAQKIGRLQRTLSNTFNNEHVRACFDERVRQRAIKQCHGDLKSPNIWIMPYAEPCSAEDPEHYLQVGRSLVKILDAIDFNPEFSNIDVLSDFALLAIDIQCRTQSNQLADEAIEFYLKFTHQNDEVARTVLSFYLVEKAIMGAAISTLFDSLSDYGRCLLRVAEQRLQALLAQEEHLRCACLTSNYYGVEETTGTLTGSSLSI